MMENEELHVVRETTDQNTVAVDDASHAVDLFEEILACLAGSN